jgi:hypothetical protein
MVFQGKVPERLMTRERQQAEWVELVRAEFVESPGLHGADGQPRHASCG